MDRPTGVTHFRDLISFPNLLTFHLLDLRDRRNYLIRRLLSILTAKTCRYQVK